MTFVNDRMLDDLREVGWHVLGVAGDATTPNVAHTVGLHQNFGHPEIVVVGLNVETLIETRIE